MELTANNLFPRFQQRLTAVGGEAYYVQNLAEAATVIADHAVLVGKELIVPPAFLEREPWGRILPLLQERGISYKEAGSPAEVADAPAGLSHAEMAVAETGSVVLAENALSARVVSMLTLTHFVLVQASDLVPMLDQAGELLQQLTRSGPQQRRYVSFVTGPSRTADIERTLTIGVQGPRLVSVLIVEDTNA